MQKISLRVAHPTTEVSLCQFLVTTFKDHRFKWKQFICAPQNIIVRGIYIA